MIETLDNFWAIYSNLVLSLGTNALLALSIYLTLSCGMLAMANAAFAIASNPHDSVSQIDSASSALMPIVSTRLL